MPWDPGSCKYRTLVRLYRAHESEEDNGAITALHHGQFTRVTLIRGKTNDRGPPRPPTEAETFLIISGLMKPRAVRMILVHASACTTKEREREREGKRKKGRKGEREERMCRRAIAFGCFGLPERPDASFSFPRPGPFVALAVYALSYVPG